jgi:hypothetical protein
MSALLYDVMPLVEGSATGFTLSPESMTAEDVATAILGRLKAMEAQGHWRDNSGQQVPLSEVGYLITVAEPEEELTEEDYALLEKLGGAN